MSQNFSVPFGLETTYDIIGFPSYEVSAYVSVFHMASMNAGLELANAMGDVAVAAECRTAVAAAQTAFDVLQWCAYQHHQHRGVL